MAYTEQERKYLMLGLRAVTEFGAIIAVPVVALSMLGKYLDGKYGTAPWLTILGFVVAFALSALSIHRRAKAIAKEYDNIDTLSATEKRDTEIKNKSNE